MRSTGYLVIIIAAAIGLVAVFGLFIYTMVTLSFGGDVFSMILRIFLFIALLLVMIFLVVIFSLKFMRSKSHGGSVARTKDCGACGQTMAATEFSCPRCFTLQTEDSK
ncbi:MAG: hypothetical protein LBE47_01260, partial [Methanomassiliicoccaceae archaeon]|nr:hypothetical protein [Methanomassiliicoccaceae archaeon]